MIGTILVIAILAVPVYFAARFCVRDIKRQLNGGNCSGCSGSCGSCSSNCTNVDKKKDWEKIWSESQQK